MGEFGGITDTSESPRETGREFVTQFDFPREEGANPMLDLSMGTLFSTSMFLTNLINFIYSSS